MTRQEFEEQQERARKQVLVIQVGNQLIKDIKSGEWEALLELLSFVPEKNLRGYLNELETSDE